MRSLKRTVMAQNGNVIITGLIAGTLAVGMAVYAAKNLELTTTALKAAKIKALMETVETQIKQKSLHPEAYRGCTSTGLANCSLNLNFFSEILFHKVSGARCAASDRECGIRVANLSLDPTARTLSAKLFYDGNDYAIKPKGILFSVPADVLQSNSFHCGRSNPETPIFRGYDASGIPQCAGFPKCPDGEFLAGVNYGTGATVCRRLPRDIRCNAEEALATFNWDGQRSNHTCRPLQIPPHAVAFNTQAPLPNFPRNPRGTPEGEPFDPPTKIEIPHPDPSRPPTIRRPSGSGPLRWTMSTCASPDTASCEAGAISSVGAGTNAPLDLTCYSMGIPPVYLPIPRDLGPCSVEGQACWLKSSTVGFTCSRGN